METPRRRRLLGPSLTGSSRSEPAGIDIEGRHSQRPSGQQMDVSGSPIDGTDRQVGSGQASAHDGHGLPCQVLVREADVGCVGQTAAGHRHEIRDPVWESPPGRVGGQNGAGAADGPATAQEEDDLVVAGRQERYSRRTTASARP